MAWSQILLRRRGWVNTDLVFEKAWINLFTFPRFFSLGEATSLEEGKLWIQTSFSFANGSGDRGSIPVWVIPKTQKMVLDAALLKQY